MFVQIDSREKPKAIGKIVEEFERQGIPYISSKLFAGDYQNLDNPRILVDRKQNLTELCGNVTQGHDRFVRELERAKSNGFRLIILVEHGYGINCLDDVKKWYNPRLKVNKSATKGITLFKILWKMQEKYGFELVFCDKKDTGKKIIELIAEDGYFAGSE